MNGDGPPRSSTPRRNFRVSHQVLSLEVSLQKQIIKGFTELTLVDLVGHKLYDNKEIKLNCRQCYIRKAYVDGVEATFHMQNFLEVVVPESEGQLIDTYTDFWRAGQFASDDGELCVYIPDEIANQRRHRRVEENGATEHRENEMKVRIEHCQIPRGQRIQGPLPWTQVAPPVRPPLVSSTRRRCRACL